MLHLNSLSPIGIGYLKLASSLAKIIVENIEYENGELEGKNAENSKTIFILGGENMRHQFL